MSHSPGAGRGASDGLSRSEPLGLKSLHHSSVGCDSRRLRSPRRAGFDPFSPSVGSWRVGAFSGLGGRQNGHGSRLGTEGDKFPAK
jgi:hypothetical protein